MSYKIVARLTGLFLRKYINNFRHEVGMKPLRKFDLLKNGDGQDIPVMHLVSEAVLPRPSDWPTSAHMTGYCFLDHGEHWAPPEELVKFLNEGPPPVYVGFGSMTGRNPRQLAKTIVESLEGAGVRGIIATGWGGMECNDLPDSIYHLKNIPHDWLFPQVAVVVHHGGAGTTAACLQSGKPSVIVPFFGDQPFWGHLVHSLGVGTKPIPRKKLTAAKLTAAIKEAMLSSDISERAQEIGQNIRREDGIGTAIAILKKIMTIR